MKQIQVQVEAITIYKSSVKILELKNISPIVVVAVLFTDAEFLPSYLFSDDQDQSY